MTRTLLCAAICACAVGARAHGQAATQSASAWRVESRAHADLWFHGLAIVGLEGFAPLPLYGADYVERIGAAKRAAGAYPTLLDTLARRLRREFERDSVFEVLHFVPLYFAQASPQQMLAAAKAVASRRSSSPPGAAASAEFGASVLRAVFRGRRQRTLLGEFATALEQEWRLFFEGYRNEQAATRTAQVEAVAHLWNRDLAPALLPFLERQQLDAGLIMVSEAVGPEGRVFAADPRDRADNVVAVRLLPEVKDARLSAYAVVRELCYPMVSRLVAESGLPGGDRIAAERISSRGAVRCGALLLDAYASAHGAAYRRFFLAAAGVRDPSSGRFEQAYPLDPTLLEKVGRATRH